LDNQSTTTTTSIISTPKSKVIALLLCFFLGTLGIHNFYLGNTGKGIIQLAITICLGWTYFPMIIIGIWIFIEFFIILFSSDLGSSKKIITVSTTTTK
jgi:TM2 domain-containing membrane protein YozV